MMADGALAMAALGKLGLSVLDALAKHQAPKWVTALAGELDIAVPDAQRAAKHLESRGLARRTKPGHYQLTSEGRKLARVRHKAATERNAPARVWHALRLARKATVPELTALAEVGAGNARDQRRVREYLSALKRAGYVTALARREVPQGRAGAGHVRYLLARDTGPLHPTWGGFGRTLLDPNTGERHRLKGGRP